MDDTRFSGAVLAGGRSTRMGKDKAFLEVDGEPLLARQLRLLDQAGASELLISGREGVDYSAFGVKVIYDALPGVGPLAGLVSALQSASFPLVLVLAVDLPAMTLAMLSMILGACTEGRGCVPVEAHRLQPLAAAYPRELSLLANAHLEDGQRSLQALVGAGVAGGLLQLLQLAPADSALFINWNQPSDWVTQT